MSAATAKVALVTGAGAASAKLQASRSPRRALPLCSRGAVLNRFAQVAAEITAHGQRALAVPPTFRRPTQRAPCLSESGLEFGRLDVLFNNAGIGSRPAPLEELTPAEWQSVIDINLTGAFLCTQEAFRLMKSQTPRGGRIINNGSISSMTPRPNSVAYTASKHAITGLTKATALEGRRYDIACGQIDIGNAATSMATHIMKGTLQADGSTAVEPTLNVEHVAEAVKYMASLPLDANVLSLTVMATKMPFVGRG